MHVLRELRKQKFNKSYKNKGYCRVRFPLFFGENGKLRHKLFDKFQKQ